ncbi:tyrosinase family protein [Aerophototrophica crusticola]|uniref:tyrosinase family protein n=1 Tax=Aerophototrophica crusticola TaxID=1709002 RepID=UPI000951F5DA
MAGIGSLAVPGLLARVASAQQPTVRYNAYSAKGKQMLAIYADAVGKMMALQTKDPRSWDFQWYTHFIPGPQNLTTKLPKILEVYGASKDPNRQLAEQMWSMCQSHLKAQNAYMFLPWHRMYVLCFEEIIRAISGKPEFTLPYWDYLDPTQKSLPEEFRQPNDPLYKSLYRPDRNKYVYTDPKTGKTYNIDVNAGTPIDLGQPEGAINLNCMQATTYDDASGVAGFCNGLNSNPHGIVHDYVGNEKGMGYVPTAANDPIFWLHHSNVDRVWASWNKNGGQNPLSEWTSYDYTFADGNGNAVSYNAAKVGDTVELGYVFDAYYGAQFGPGTAKVETLQLAVNTAPVGAAAPAPVQAAAATGPTVLGAGLTRAVLTSTSEGTALFQAAPKAPAAGKRMVLELSQLVQSGPVGQAFNVYIGEDAKSGTYVGQVSFFPAMPADMDHSAHGGTAGGVNAYFDITNEVASGAISAKMLAKPVVAFLPAGPVNDAAKPTVGAILIRQV